jgi:signal transduction histidine kinase
MSTTAVVDSDREDWLSSGGEMGERTRAFDWSKSPVGPMADWPQSLKTVVQVMLRSRYPMFVWWGRDLTKFYNDAYIPMLGERHPSALGRSAAEVWSDVWPIVGPQTEAVLNEGRATWNEERLLLMERNHFLEETYFTFSYSPIPDDQGGVGGVICAVTEDTQRILSQRRLRTLRALAEQAGQAKTAVGACQVAASILAENPHDLPFTLLYLLDDGQRATLAGLTGVGRDTPASPAALDLDDPTAAWPLREVAETCKPLEVVGLSDQFGPLPGGVWPKSPQRAVILPMAKAGQSQLAGFVVAGISPRLAFNDDYKGFMNLLAGHVATAVASAHAYDEERRRAEALAELDRAKTTFFSNVSHEFRTPLTLILGPLEDALADTKERWQRDRLELLHRNALRLQKLVNTLLDFSRLEAGRIQASYEPTDLAAFTAELASVFRSAVEKAGMRLVADCPPLSEPVYVDRDMYEKVVLNLLSNAFKFTLEGEIEVKLRNSECGLREESGRRQSEIQNPQSAILTVRDTGTGISEEQLPHIFERFHRIEGARARTHEGTGIGLSLVQELVKLHGGTVSVESVVGEGSTFTVSIPKGKAHLPADRIGTERQLASTALAAEHYLEEALRWLPAESGGKDQEAGARGQEAGVREVEAGVARQGPEQAVSSCSLTPAPCLPAPAARPRIVWADDNADMRDYVGRLLAPLYDVEAVADGQAALTAVQRQPPDLVLADVMMPQLDGFACCRRFAPTNACAPCLSFWSRRGPARRAAPGDY